MRVRPLQKMHCGYAVWRKWVKIGTPPLLLLSTGSEANMVIYIATYSLMMALCSQVHFVAAMRYLLFSLICLSAMPSACNTYHSTPSHSKPRDGSVGSFLVAHRNSGL